MAIKPLANPANVRRSVEKYLIDQLQGSNGIPDDVEAGAWWWFGRKIDTASRDYFVRVALRRASARHYARVNDTDEGYWVSYLLELEVYGKRVAYDTTPHIIEQTLALVRDSLKRGTAIAVKDYEENAGSATTQGNAICEESRQPSMPSEGEWLRGMWETDITLVEQDASA